MAMIIDGKIFAGELRATLTQQVRTLRELHRLTPGLAVVLVGEDPASQVYVRNKGVQAREVGIRSFEHKLPPQTSQAELLALVATAR